jgi:hypothetical protein
MVANNSYHDKESNCAGGVPDMLVCCRLLNVVPYGHKFEKDITLPFFSYKLPHACV